MTFNYYPDAKGEWRWNLKANNNRIVATSGEGYQNRQDCLDAIQRIKDEAKDAGVEKVDQG